MSNMGRLILHSAVDEWKYFTVSPCVSVSYSLCIWANIFWFYCFPILFWGKLIDYRYTPLSDGQFIKYVSSYKPVTKDYDFTKFVCHSAFFTFLWNSRKVKFLFFLTQCQNSLTMQFYFITLWFCCNARCIFVSMSF